MDRPLQNLAITAISDSEDEGFLASSLFNSGWQVQFRALDFPSLETFLADNQLPQVTVLLSTDLVGLSADGISKISKKGYPVYLFSSSSVVVFEGHPVMPFPKSALELIALLRGSFRAPLLRSQAEIENKVRARSIAVSSVLAGSGGTTLAINVAAELSLSGARVLLVDANSDAPAIATLLDGRGLRQRDDFSNIAENLWAMEFTQESIARDVERLYQSQFEFDFVVLDIGVMRDFPQVLTGKRWSGEAINWVSNNCDSLLLLSRSDLLSLQRLRNLAQLISQNPIKPTLKFVHMMRPHGKAGNEADLAFLDCISSLSSEKALALPIDLRSVQGAQKERATLYESAERSPLRRVIADLAGQLRG